MLHVRSAGPFKILNKLNCNAYAINLFRDYDISCIFNVNDLVDCKSFGCSPLVVKPSPKSFYEIPHLLHFQILISLQQRRLIKF